MLSRGSGEASVWVDLGRLALDGGEVGKALEYLDKAQALEPSDEVIRSLVESAREELGGGMSP